MELLESFLPPFVIQVAGFFAIVIGGAIMYVRGKNTKSEAEATNEQIEKERDELREKIAASLLRDTAQTLREDIAKVLTANRESFFKTLGDHDDRNQQRFHSLSDRLRNLEIENAGVKRDLAHLMLERRLP